MSKHLGLVKKRIEEGENLTKSANNLKMSMKHATKLSEKKRNELKIRNICTTIIISIAFFKTSLYQYSIY